MSKRMSRWPLCPYKDKRNQAFDELQAMRTLKKTVSEVENSSTNFLAILTDTFRSYDTDPGPSAYSFIIKYLSHRHLFSHLHPILDHLENVEKFEVPERIFVELIQHYGKLGLLQDAINIFYRIPKFRCNASAFSLNSLLHVLCKKHEGLVLVRDVLMKSLDMKIRLETSSFRILIRSLCSNGKVSSAIELLDFMQLDESTIPDSKMYSLVLGALCKQGSAIHVMGFLETMQKAGFLPSTSDYNRVIDVLVSEGQGNDAYSVLDKMISDGNRPNIMSYNSVLKGFLLANDFLKVDEVFDEILLMGLIPNVSTYNIYIDCLCKQRKFDGACRMVICMEKAGCRPEVTTFNVLISGYSKIGEIGKAREVMNKMIQKGISWDIHTYESLINGLIREGEIIVAEKMLLEMLSKGHVPHASTFNSLVCSLCRICRLSEAFQMLDEMLSRSILPDATLWESLIVGYKLDRLGGPIDLEVILE